MGTPSTFDNFALPVAGTAFSAGFFRDLTFQQAIGLNYPVIAPAGSVSAHIFSSGIPFEMDAVNVMPNEIVPHVDDILPIIREAREAYHSTGVRRSVHVQLTIDGMDTECVYHFSKVCTPYFLLPKRLPCSFCAPII